MIMENVAQKTLKTFGITFREDFHTLRGDQVQALLDEAKAQGYRHPKNANGSTARYFFAAVQRKLKSGVDPVEGPYTKPQENKTVKWARYTVRMFKKRAKIYNEDVVDLITDLLHLAEAMQPSTATDDAAQGVIDSALNHFRAETRNQHAKGE